jgi:hypothetical protein
MNHNMIDAVVPQIVVVLAIKNYVQMTNYLTLSIVWGTGKLAEVLELALAMYLIAAMRWHAPVTTASASVIGNVFGVLLCNAPKLKLTVPKTVSAQKMPVTVPMPLNITAATFLLYLLKHGWVLLINRPAPHHHQFNHQPHRLQTFHK